MNKKAFVIYLDYGPRGTVTQIILISTFDVLDYDIIYHLGLIFLISFSYYLDKVKTIYIL